MIVFDRGEGDVAMDRIAKNVLVAGLPTSGEDKEEEALDAVDILLDWGTQWDRLEFCNSLRDSSSIEGNFVSPVIAKQECDEPCRLYAILGKCLGAILVSTKGLVRDPTGKRAR